VRDFQGNNDVSFGDVNLAEQPIRENYSPGAGGWPTVRYFNKETGLDGAPYDKKTDKAMCDELGDMEYMAAYIEEAGKTSLCALDGSGCSDKQKAYIAKMKERGSDEQQKQLTRLENMKESSMTQDLLAWLKQRKKILQQLLDAGDDEKVEL